jgi:hypothetical protein
VFEKKLNESSLNIQYLARFDYNLTKFALITLVDVRWAYLCNTSRGSLVHGILAWFLSHFGNLRAFLAKFLKTLLASQTLITLLKYHLTKQIFKCGPTTYTLFKTSHKTLKKNKTLFTKYLSKNNYHERTKGRLMLFL